MLVHPASASETEIRGKNSSTSIYEIFTHYILIAYCRRCVYKKKRTEGKKKNRICTKTGTLHIFLKRMKGSQKIR